MRQARKALRVSTGFFTGCFRNPDDLAPDDWRRHFARFEPVNFQHNLELLRWVETLAAEKFCKPSQLALA